MTEKTNKYKKKRPYLPKDGSEDAHSLLIPLHNFKLHHDTFNKDDRKDDGKQDKAFIGRDEIFEQLCELLLHTKNNRGSYLIAGYRGSGKTSLINQVLIRYKSKLETDKKDKKNKKDKKKKVIIAKINLGHDEILDARHVLFNITSVLKHEFNHCYKKSKEGRNYFLINIFVSVPILIATTLFTYSQLEISSNINTKICTEQHLTTCYLRSRYDFKYLNAVQIKDLHPKELPIYLLSFFILFFIIYNFKETRKFFVFHKVYRDIIRRKCK